MFKTNQPSEENRPPTTPKVSNSNDHAMGQHGFRSHEELSDWIDGELATLESLYVDFTSKDSLRGYFSR